MFEKISNQLEIKRVSYEDGVRQNPMEYQSANRPKLRDTFYIDMMQSDFEMLEKNMLLRHMFPFEFE